MPPIMFNGERIVMQKEQLTRDYSFLLRNGVKPWATVSIPIPTILRTTLPLEIFTIAEQIYDQVSHHLKTDTEHQIHYSYRRAWQNADAQSTKAAINELCENQHSLIKAYDISRSMFDFQTNIHNFLISKNIRKRRVFIDIACGVSSRYGDGQRYHDGAKWSFSQMKGLRTHTTHLYFQGISR